MLYYGQKAFALAQRHAGLASKLKPWDMRAFHSSQRRHKQYLGASQEVGDSFADSGDNNSAPVLCPRPLTKSR